MSFQKKDFPVSSFQSSWKTDQEVSVIGCQTEHFGNKDEESQVLTTDNVAIQTDEEVPRNYETVSYDEDSLLAFLRHITPKVEEELSRASSSRAFDGFNLVEEDADAEATCLHILRWQNVDPEQVVVALDWSCTGSVVCVGYGVHVHDDWCTHKGAVAVWNVSSSNFTASVPDQVIDIYTCVTCLAFHPTNPALLAVGSVNGAVSVLDLSRTQEATTPWLSVDAGNVSITRVAWATNPKSISLFSASAGGEVIKWNIDLVAQKISLIDGFCVKQNDIPRSRRLAPSGTKYVDSENEGVPLSALSFTPHNEDAFVVGTETGDVLLCSTEIEAQNGVSLYGWKLRRCVRANFRPHAGRVAETLWSPFHHHAILSLGSDHTLNLFTLLQPSKPVSVLHSEDSLTCAAWLPWRPGVAAVGSSVGGVVVLRFATAAPEEVIRLPPHEKAAPISSIAFNRKNVRLLATGDQLSRVCIWRLPESIIGAKPGDQTVFEQLLHVIDE